MSKVEHAIHEIHYIETISKRDQWVNRIHPLVKLCITLFFIAITVSFPKYDLIGLLAMAVYPFVLFQLAELSVKEALWRLKVVLPIVCMMGIFNPLFDRSIIVIEGITVRAGLFSMVTLMVKGILTVLATYLLVATTSIEKICYALRRLHIPAILVTEVLLIYRYMAVLLSEVNRITQAYALRAPGQKGIRFQVWGSLMGQLLLRSIDRAGEVYDSMILRGYQGEFRYFSEHEKGSIGDAFYIVIWVSLFVLFRKVPVILVIGNIVGGLFL